LSGLDGDAEEVLNGLAHEVCAGAGVEDDGVAVIEAVVVDAAAVGVGDGAVAAGDFGGDAAEGVVGPIDGEGGADENDGDDGCWDANATALHRDLPPQRGCNGV